MRCRYGAANADGQAKQLARTMTESLPFYVDHALQEWETIAFTAYEGFERVGRGVVGVSPEGESTQLLYAERSFFVDLHRREVGGRA